MPISYVYVGEIRRLLFKITNMDMILMGYWMTGQVRTTMSSLIYTSKFRMGDMILSRIIMITREMFLRTNFSNTIRIAVLDSGRDRVGGLGDLL